MSHCEVGKISPSMIERTRPGWRGRDDASTRRFCPGAASLSRMPLSLLSVRAPKRLALTSASHRPSCTSERLAALLKCDPKRPWSKCNPRRPDPPPVIAGRARARCSVAARVVTAVEGSVPWGSERLQTPKPCVAPWQGAAREWARDGSGDGVDVVGRTGGHRANCTAREPSSTPARSAFIKSGRVSEGSVGCDGGGDGDRDCGGEHGGDGGRKEKQAPRVARGKGQGRGRIHLEAIPRTAAWIRIAERSLAFLRWCKKKRNRPLYGTVAHSVTALQKAPLSSRRRKTCAKPVFPYEPAGSQT